MEKTTDKSLQDLIGKEIEYEFYKNGNLQPMDSLYKITKTYLKKDLINLEMKSEHDNDLLCLNEKEFENFIQGKKHIHNIPLVMEDGTQKPFITENFTLKAK